MENNQELYHDMRRIFAIKQLTVDLKKEMKAIMKQMNEESDKNNSADKILKGEEMLEEYKQELKDLLKGLPDFTGKPKEEKVKKEKKVRKPKKKNSENICESNEPSENEGVDE